MCSKVFILNLFFLLDTRGKIRIKYPYETRRGDYQDQTRELTQTQGHCCLEASNYALHLRVASRCRIATDSQAGKEGAMKRSHLIRLNTTPEQEVYFRKACGVTRHAYNWALDRWKAARAEGKRVTVKALKVEYNSIKGEQFPWVYETTKCAPEQAFADLGQAFANYWRMKREGTQPKLKHPRKDGEEAGFPHSKSKKRDRLSFYLANDKFSVHGPTLHVPKLGKVNMTEELRLQGKILSAVISSRAGWWFVSSAVEVEHETPTHGGGTVGIDLGIKTLATLSGGEKFENQKHYRKSRGAYPGLKQGPISQSRGETELVEEYPETGKGTLSCRVPTSGCLAQDVYAGCPNLCRDWPGRPQHERNAG